MAIFRCWWDCEAAGYRWKETFYHQGDENQRQDIVNKLITVANRRVQLFARQVTMTAANVSDDGVRFDTSRTSKQLGQAPNWTGTDGVRDQIASGWYAGFYGGFNHRRSYILRGMPDDWLQFDADNANLPVYPQELTNRFNALKEQLINQGFGMKVLTPPGANDEKAILTIADDGNGRYKVTLDPGLTVAAGDKIIIRRADTKKYPNLNKQHKVKSVSGDDVTLWTKHGLAAVPTTIGLALFRHVNYSFVAFDRAELLRPSRRKTGGAQTHRDSPRGSHENSSSIRWVPGTITPFIPS